MITKEEKAEIVQRYASNPKGTGHAVVQIALLTKRIEGILKHLKTSEDDHSSRRGLLKLVSRRRALLKYLRRRDPGAAEKLRSDLDLN